MSEFQPTLDFTQKLPPDIQQKIAEGMQQADENANVKWKHVFDACVLAAALKKPTITSDDVITEMELLKNPPDTHNLSAIGSAMRRACKMGILSRTPEVRRSERPEKHGNRQNVWVSNYFGGKA